MSRDRDRILEQALKHELRAADMAATDACLDAETLGAWADDGLDAAAMVAAEAHVSSCARCQALVGAMIKSAPSTEAPGTLGTLGTLGTQGTFPLWRWWLAPIAAGVTAVTLWMVIPEQQELATAPPRAGAAKAAPDPVTTESAAPPASLEAAADRLSRRDSQPSAELRVNQEQNKATEERKEEAPARQQRERAALADAPAAPAPPAAALPGAVAESAAPRENAAPGAIAALQKRQAPAPIEIPTLDPSLGWRIVGDRLERSDNGGATWTVKRQNASDAIVAGSAPSNSVGWFVGRAGRVLLTIDSGATFTDVSLAEPLDLASIAAIDARNASVYSVVGRRFRTDDGGRTWRPF